MKVKYNFQRLKGRIKEYYGSQENFAKVLGIAENTLSRKMTNNIRFSYDEIATMIDILHIKPNEVQDIFFTKEG